MSSGFAPLFLFKRTYRKGLPLLLCGCLLAFPPLSLCSASSDASLPAAASMAGRRFSATRFFSPDVSSGISADAAAVVAAAAARGKAMQAVVRELVLLPDVRIAGSVGPTPAKTPNLLALAHATVKTDVLLVSRNRKASSVTVTVVIVEGDATPPLAARVRDALVHPDRLALYEKAVLREKALLDTFETPALGAPSRIPSGTGGSGDTARAINEIKALEIFKEQLPSWSNVWSNPSASRDAMRAALALAPDSALCHYALGDALLQLGRSHEALEEQTLALRFDPSFARAFHSRGAASLALQYLSSAVADFSKAISLSPATAAYYRARGMARHLQGEAVAMCRDLHQACALGECEEFQWAVAERLCRPQ